MKWTNHIDLSKKAMFSYNIRYTSDLINGVIYPDRVGQQGGQVLGVDVGYPHHAKTKSRIKKLLINLRKKKLESGVIDQFSLGVLLHLVQDSESFSFSHPNFEWFQTAMKDIKIDRRVQYEEVPFLGQNITKNEHLSYLSSMNQLCEPPVSLYNGYIKTKMVVRSLCSPNKLPHHLKESYIKNKASLAKKKISRTMYWLFTYLSPLAPLNLFADLGAIKSKTMVERYKRAKDTSFIKGGVSFMMGFFYCFRALPVKMSSTI